MSGYIFTNPLIKTRVLTYERLAWKTENVWFREYHLFASNAEIEEDLEHYKNSVNIRNVEVYDIVIDLQKYARLALANHGCCKGCGKEIAYNTEDNHITCVNGEWYCDYKCYCETHPEETKRLLKS